MRSTRSRDRYETNTQRILHLDVPIHVPSNGWFGKGQYEFPFQFVIPEGIPSSMHCRNGQSVCEVKYEMRAYLCKDAMRSNAGNSFFNPFQSNTFSSNPTPFHIYGNSNVPKYPTTNDNQLIPLPREVHQVRNCCCFQRGTMELNASITDIHLIPQQPQTLSFHLQNHSKAHVDNVTVEILERVSWKPQFRETANQYSLHKHVLPGHSHSDWRSVEQNIQDNIRHLGDREYQSANAEDDNANGQSVELSIPHTARDTYHGRMIRIDHYVRVKVHTKGCCTTNPETTTDVYISRPAHLFSSCDNTSFATNNVNVAAGSGWEKMNPHMSMPSPSAPVMEEEYVVEATVLPEDWTPVMSDVVKLPVATVMGVESVTGQEGSYQTGGGSYAAPAVPIVPSMPVPSAPPKGS